MDVYAEVPGQIHSEERNMKKGRRPLAPEIAIRRNRTTEPVS